MKRRALAGGFLILGATLVVVPVSAVGAGATREARRAAPAPGGGPLGPWEVTIRRLDSKVPDATAERLTLRGRCTVQLRAGASGRRAFRVAGLLVGDADGSPAAAPSSPPRLLVRQRGRILPLPVGSVDWAGSEGDYVRLHAGGRTHLVAGPLARVERELAPWGFVRVHRNAVVNLHRVRQLRPLGSGRYGLSLADGTELVVSRRHSAGFRGLLV
jgi:DNA-binding LytR/AlgR family response regulator